MKPQNVNNKTTLSCLLLISEDYKTHDYGFLKKISITNPIETL